MLDYEGAHEIERAWHEGLTPDPLLSVSTWADQHRMLDSRNAAEPEALSARQARMRAVAFSVGKLVIRAIH